MYKTYLHCAAKVVRANRGEVTAYDGDRIMAVFIGPQKCSSAATAALQLHFARTELLNCTRSGLSPDAICGAPHGWNRHEYALRGT